MPDPSVKVLSERQPRSASTRQNPTDLIKSRRTDELVLGFCGPVGSGISTVADRAAKILKEYDYKINYIKVSDFIEHFAPHLLTKKTIPKNNKAERIRLLQDAGNKLREKYENNFLAQIAIRNIARDRLRDSESLDSDQEVVPARKRRRVAHIVDSLKHPAERDLLKQVYGNMFYLFGVLCAEHTRVKRLSARKKIKYDEAATLMERDKNEEEIYGQKLLKTIHHSDFFIRNNHFKVGNLDQPIRRFIELILGNNVFTPTTHEFAMYIAYSAALRSGCLSRQVGAAILSEDNTILSTGRNDVPKFGGGLYSEDDSSNDNRCLHLYGNECKNQEYKNRIFSDIEEIIKNRIKDKDTADSIISEINNHEKLKYLLEYCRAVHAEMDAIISCCRNNNGSLKNAVMYCTTFPCHHCARHIVASGIKKVYYIEPYEKSMALELHEDSIEIEPENVKIEKDKVIFLNFEGVSPTQYTTLFRADDRKNQGIVEKKDLKSASPVTAKLLDTFTDYEAKVASHLDTLNLPVKLPG